MEKPKRRLKFVTEVAAECPCGWSSHFLDSEAKARDAFGRHGCFNRVDVENQRRIKDELRSRAGLPKVARGKW